MVPKTRRIRRTIKNNNWGNSL